MVCYAYFFDCRQTMKKARVYFLFLLLLCVCECWQAFAVSLTDRKVKSENTFYQWRGRHVWALIINEPSETGLGQLSKVFGKDVRSVGFAQNVSFSLSTDVESRADTFPVCEFIGISG